VVFLHGFGLDLRMWESQAAALADHFMVIRYDMRGYGRSSLPTTEPYSHSDDLAALLAHLGVDSAHIVGLSAGGRNALRFAMAFPKIVRSLTLADSALDGFAWSADWQGRWNAIANQAKSGDLQGAKRMWLEHPLFAPAREQPALASRLSDMVYDYSGWHWINADPGLAPASPAISRLASVGNRTLVVCGDRDLPDFQDIAATLVAGIPGATRVAIPGAGHMANMEAPAAFNDALLHFLA
jgi:pimeloyl-ACP methyl ester carboxylesterase